MRKIRVSIDGNSDEDTEIFEGFTDDVLPASGIALSRDEAGKFLDSSPFDYRFMKRKNLSFLRVYRGERYEDIPSTPIPIENGDLLEGYFLDGFDLVEIE